MLSKLPHCVFSARRKALILALYLQFIGWRWAAAEDHISFKWQDYSEDDERIRVESRYLGFEKQINAKLSVKGHGVYDSISGATPQGSLDEDDQTVILGEFADTREAGVLDFVWTDSLHATTFNVSYSDEPDFISRSYAIKRTSEFNKRNTGFTYGLSYTDDEIQPSFFTQSRERDSWDYILGISQVVDPNTVVSLNFTYSDYDGFLSDPYKIIRQTRQITPSLSIPLTFPENRPNERKRRIWFFNIKRFFDQANGSLDADYRYFSDSWGIESHTIDLEWYQKLGERWILRPKLRWYQQGAADFYALDLDDAPFMAPARPGPGDPTYSADYRLAKFRSYTYGIKAIFKATDNFDIDVSLERYEMKSRDGATPQAAFADADVLTIGSTLWF